MWADLLAVLSVLIVSPSHPEHKYSTLPSSLGILTGVAAATSSLLAGGMIRRFKTEPRAQRDLFVVESSLAVVFVGTLSNVITIAIRGSALMKNGFGWDWIYSLVVTDVLLSFAVGMAIGLVYQRMNDA
ncbi:hypothetical protein C8Q74DRAFT_1215989 [Fomes fomentarius]|nr:hypothetical protein C8Q74DRAFT_1215989 [Fomes fomentarius]